MVGRVVITLGALLACCPCALALDPSLDISQYAHAAWTIRDGFFDGLINSIAQTPDGYLWLGTELGLLRFDGIRKVPWQPPPGERLPNPDITKLLVSHDGRLWIGTLTGLASWKDGKLVHYPELDGQSSSTLLEDHEGTVWVGGAGDPTARLCAIRNGGIACFGQDGSFGRTVLSLFEENGNLWAGTGTGLWRWKPGPPKRYAMPLPEVYDLNNVDGGPLLIAMRGGIRQLINKKPEPYPIPGAPQPFNPRHLLRDRNGDLWIGTVEHGLVHVHQGRTDLFTRSDGLSGDVLSALFEDREGDVWVGTSEGLDRFRDLAVHTISARQGLASEAVVSVLAARDGSIWLGTRGGLDRWTNGQVTAYTKRDGLPDYGADSLFEDGRGRIWVSTLSGIAYLEDGRFVSVRSIPSRIAHTIIEDGSGGVWINDQEQGLIHLVDEKVVEQIPWSALGRKDTATALARDPGRGGLWLGFFDGGVGFIKDGQIRESYGTAEGLGAGRIWDLGVYADGSVWAPTAAGLSRINDHHVATLNSRNGLPCDTVHWAIEDNDQTLWLYMACGLVRIPQSEVNAWIADPKHRVIIGLLDASDGVRLHSVPFSTYSPPVAKSADGRLWFVAGGGISVIDPRHLPFNNLRPPVHIEGITADRKIYQASDGKARLLLPGHVRDLQIDYTALSLVAAEKVRFRYKLEGHDSDWQDVGNRRQAFYTDLAPRNYRFRVTASNNSGVWNEAGDTLEFSIAPAYYQTDWFRALIAAIVLGAAWGLYRLRLYQIAREFNVRLEERVSERTRLARDLHDTLLQSFHGLMLRLQVVDKLMPQGKAKDELEKTLERADQAIAEGRSAVYDLRSSTTETNELAEAVKTVANELSADGTATFDLVVEGGPRELHPIIRDEIYRICREALRNAFQHAHARHIEAEINYGEPTFELRIRDDGQGIPADILEQGRPGHYGLPGIRERAKQVGAELTIWSRAGTGTEIELRVAGSIAYGTLPRRSRFRLFQKKVG